MNAAVPTALDIARACRLLRLEPADGGSTSVFLPSLSNSRNSSTNGCGSGGAGHGSGLPARSRPNSAAQSQVLATSGTGNSMQPLAASLGMAAPGAHIPRPCSGLPSGSSAHAASYLARTSSGRAAASSGSATGMGAIPHVAGAGAAAALAMRMSSNGMHGLGAAAVLGASAEAASSLTLSARDLTSYAARAELCQHLRSFVAGNENPATSPNYQSTDPDPVGVFVALLGDKNVGDDSELVLLLLKTLKILSRKQDNRLMFGEEGMRAVLFTLAPPLTQAIAAEGANVLLNVCYEADNVQALLRTPALTFLVAFLSDEEEDLQANAAGAIQSVCYQAKGRASVRELDGIPALLGLLDSPNAKVVTRAVGAIHNISADAGSIRIIRTAGGIPHLVRLLSNEQLPIAGSAAGALQNVSREVASRLIIRELDAVPPLAKLMSAPDVHAQVCAAGALLNIVGPEIPDTPQGTAKRTALGRIMSTLMAASMVFDAVYEQRPPLG